MRAGQALVLALASFVATCGHGATGPRERFNSPMTVQFSRSTVSQGDTLEFTVLLPGPVANVEGDVLDLTFSGVAQGSDSLRIDPNVLGYTFGLVVPGEWNDGSLNVTVSIPAVRQSATASISIKDARPPTLDSIGIGGVPPLPSYNASTGAGAAYLGAGVTDTVRLWVSDDHALKSVAWALLPPAGLQDSVTVTGRFAELTIPITLPDTLAGQLVEVQASMRDADNNQAGTGVGVPIVGFDQHPVHVVAIHDTITDLAFDSARGVAYIAQPDSGELAVLSLSSATFGAPIHVSGRPVSLDLTPGGDSLLVALDGSDSLAVVRLTGTPQQIGFLQVPPYVYTTCCGLQPDPGTVSRIRVASDAHAIVTMIAPNAGGAGGSFYGKSLNLLNDSLVPTEQSGTTYTVAPSPAGRSADATEINVPGALSYNSLTQSYVNAVGAANGAKPLSVFISNSSAPTVTMVGHFVGFSYSGAYIGLDTLYGATIAANGTDGYVVETACAAGDASCVDTATGTLLKYNLHYIGGANKQYAGTVVNFATIPYVATELTISPDAKTLIGIAPRGLMVVDLSTVIPPTLSVLTRLRRFVPRALAAAANSPRHPTRHARVLVDSAGRDLHSLLRVKAVRRVPR